MDDLFDRAYEQLARASEGEDVDKRRYLVFGAVLYEMVAGSHVYEGWTVPGA